MYEFLILENIRDMVVMGKLKIFKIDFYVLIIKWKRLVFKLRWLFFVKSSTGVTNSDHQESNVCFSTTLVEEEVFSPIVSLFHFFFFVNIDINLVKVGRFLRWIYYSFNFIP